MTDKTQYNQDSSTSLLTKEEKVRAYHRAYYHDNKEAIKKSQKAYTQRNKNQINLRQKSYRKQNKEATKRWSKTNYQKNKEKGKEKTQAYQKAYREANKEKRKEYQAEYARSRRQKDSLYNFFHSIRSQAVRVVKQVGLGKKPANTFKWVGCSPEELKAHIESLFLEGMTWDNYGKYGWHIDHIRPVSSFEPEEWEQINHYTNLQPLWWQDNLSKSDKLQ